jgi:SAM-dependent methyltransferase
VDESFASEVSPDEWSPQQITKAILSGTLPNDDVFDRHLPLEMRVVSSRFWTPLRVAVAVGRWLGNVGARSVVDIGSGPGKFCIAASLVTDCVYFGIEHRTKLVEAAQDLAQRFNVEARVAFIEGSFGDVAISNADAFYFFNPFGENLYWCDERLDDTVPIGPNRYRHDVALARRFLTALRVGTHVVTYNGFGGRVPDSFVEVRGDDSLPNTLRMWRKES